MRIFANVSCEGHFRTFEIAVGAGDKTFKWLSLAISQLYAAAAPNGQLRRRDDYRGSSARAEQHAVDIIIPGNISPHPAAMISDYLRDLDTVDVTLITEMPVNKLGNPASTNWATLAFTSTEDHNSVLYDEDTADEKKFSNDSDDLAAKKSKAEFMRIVMRAQMLNEKKRAHEIRVVWQKAAALLPKLTEADAMDVQEVLFKEWAVILETFTLYAPTGSMDLREFERMCDDACVFSEKDCALLSARAFNRVIKASVNKISSLTVDNGTFLVALLVLSQIRHNDIYEKDSQVSTAEGYLSEIVSNKLRVLAQRLSYKCIPKEVFCSTEFLFRLREVYDDLVTVFEKYAARHNRDIYTSLPYENTAELLFEARLAESVSIENAEAFLQRVRSGPVNGRDLLQPPHPEEEFLFPELVEAAVLSQYDNAVRVMNGQKSLLGSPGSAAGPRTAAGGKKPAANAASTTEPATEEAEQVSSSPYPVLPSEMQIPVDILQAFTVALQKLVGTLAVVPEEVVKNRRPGYN
jgi:hypothetical protein